MDVSGKQHAGSDDTNTGLFCDPCEAAGDAENAENYCLDCHEFLCLSCGKAHKRQTFSRGHQLLGRDEMPKKKMAISSEHKCSKHDQKPFDYFCENHNVLCCTVCLNLDHRQCAAEYITDLVERYERNGEYEALRTEMRNLDGLIGETKTRTESNITATKRSADQLMSDIKKFRAEINASLDSQEKQVLEQVNKVKNENIQKMRDIARQLDTIKAEQDAMSAKMEELSKLGRKKELVIAIKLNDTNISTMRNRVGSLTEENILGQLQFHRNDRILDKIKSTGLGKVSKIPASGRWEVKMPNQQRLDRRSKQRNDDFW